MPEGADTVVAFEETSGFGFSVVEIYKATKHGANVRYAGEEVHEGEIVLHKGESITPSDIAILASFGYASATVQRAPRVSIVTVGDELRMPGEEVSGAEIYNCNRFMLAAACRSVGIEPVGIRHASDDKESLRNVLALSLAESDLLITTGGISTGEYDFVQQELASLGVVKTFWNVSQKPGKPLYFGSSETGCAVFSLPGNPISTIVCFVEYCLPALSTLMGKASHGKFSAILAAPFPSDKKRHRFLLGTVWAKEGRLLCKTSPKCESHMITSVTGSNCILEAGPSSEILPEGTEITCTLLPWASLR
jgi:molybdopterin molybdotransferase